MNDENGVATMHDENVAMDTEPIESKGKGKAIDPGPHEMMSMDEPDETSEEEEEEEESGAEEEEAVGSSSDSVVAEKDTWG